MGDRNANRLSIRLILLVTVASALAGLVPNCTRAALLVATAPAGREMQASTSQTLTVDGVTRTFDLYDPQPLTPDRPLFIVLTGGFSNGAAIEALTGFDQIAAQNHFVVAYPDPEGNGWQQNCCGPNDNATQDIDFVNAIIGHLTTTAEINPARVDVVGFSLGGAFAYRLACEDASRITGMGSVGGFEYLSIPCQPSRPVSVMEIHGTLDYYGGSCGGQTQTDAGCPNGFGQSGYEPSVAQVNAQWRHSDGCPVPRTRAVGGLSQLTASPCAHGTGVKLVTIEGGGHCWPGGSQGPCTAYDASLALWKFLSSHPQTNRRSH